MSTFDYLPRRASHSLKQPKSRTCIYDMQHASCPRPWTSGCLGTGNDVLDDRRRRRRTGAQQTPTLVVAIVADVPARRLLAACRLPFVLSLSLVALAVSADSMSDATAQGDGAGTSWSHLGISGSGICPLEQTQRVEGMQRPVGHAMLLGALVASSCARRACHRSRLSSPSTRAAPASLPSARPRRVGIQEPASSVSSN